MKSKSVFLALMSIFMLASCNGSADNGITSLSLNKKTLELTVGGSEKLIATFTPETASNIELAWSSSDLDIASVDGTGLVSALAVGTSTISVKSGKYTASCNVTVSAEDIDYSVFPNYVEDVDQITYQFDDEQISNPFWKGNVIYNETVLLEENSDTGIISGKLAYTPTRIISVRDFTLKTTTYEEGVDFEVEGNSIIRKQSSSMPYLKDTTLRGEYLPEPYVLKSSISNVQTDCMAMGPTFYTESPLYYSNQIQVTYAYDVHDVYDNLNSFPSYKLDLIPNLKAKLEAKQPIKIVGLGDSILEGCSSSKKFNHEPFMDDFLTMTKKNLARLYDTEVVLDNQSVGGKTASWGAMPAQTSSVVAANPDLVFLHFGVNDLGANTSANAYLDDMLTIVGEIKSGLPNVEIIIFTPFGTHPGIYDYEKFEKYKNKIQTEIVDEMDGVMLLDVLSLSKQLYKQKKYYDMTANGINHVNDYASRIYLQSILATLYSY